MGKNKSELKKEVLLKALKKTRGDITAACKAVNVNRQTFYNWKEADEEFAKLYEDIADEGLDFAESIIFNCMEMARPLPKIDENGYPVLDEEGNPVLVQPNFKDADIGLRAATFYLERKGKLRGYSIRTELEDVTERERLRMADLFPDSKMIDKLVEKHEEQKKKDQEKPAQTNGEEN